MVNVGAVRVLVDARFVAVRVAVFAAHWRIMMMIVMSVVVAVRVLVVQRLVRVAVPVTLRQMEVHADAEQ